jgi:hypothetical protein
MKYCFVFLIALLTLAAACTWSTPNQTKPAITKDTLVYNYKNFKKRDKSCGDKPDSACAIYMVNYPQFDAQQLNNLMLNVLGNKVPNLTIIDTLLQRSATDFMQGYSNDTAAHSRGAYYQFMDSILVVRQDSSLITLQERSYSYTGGAHGMYGTNLMNYDINAHRRLQLGDIITDGMRNHLTDIAEKIFRRDEKLSPTASLGDNYFFKDNKFTLPDNFLITPTGLRFVYHPYEIKPYAAGETELFIPYTTIRGLLKPNTVISQYHFK